jgi:hypothetical protein
VKRIYPEAKTALIKWIEDNFNDIDNYLFICNVKSDGSTMTVYDCDTFMSAAALAAIQEHTLHTLAENDDFICRPEPEEH